MNHRRKIDWERSKIDFHDFSDTSDGHAPAARKAASEISYKCAPWLPFLNEVVEIVLVAADGCNLDLIVSTNLNQQRRMKV